MNGPKDASRASSFSRRSGVSAGWNWISRGRMDCGPSIWSTRPTRSIRSASASSPSSQTIRSMSWVIRSSTGSSATGMIASSASVRARRSAAAARPAGDGSSMRSSQRSSP